MGGRSGRGYWAIREIAVANKQMKKKEREEEGRSGFLWQMGCETIRGGASRGGPRAGAGMVRPKATMAS